MGDIKVVELFAGVGGFRLGLEAALDRYKVIWANQWEPYKADQWAFDCYVSHFGKSPNHVCKDIAVAKKDIPDHDLLVGGFPCQDYSIMKKNSAGIEGKKGVLWWQIDDILREKRPSYVILENVDRLIRSPAKQCVISLLFSGASIRKAMRSNGVLSMLPTMDRHSAGGGLSSSPIITAQSCFRTLQKQSVLKA